MYGAVSISYIEDVIVLLLHFTDFKHHFVEDKAAFV